MGATDEVGDRCDLLGIAGEQMDGGRITVGSAGRQCSMCSQPLGRQPLVNELIQAGTLVVPFQGSLVGPRGYYIIESRLAAGKPHVREFAQWLLAEAARDAEQAELHTRAAS